MHLNHLKTPCPVPFCLLPPTHQSQTPSLPQIPFQALGLSTRHSFSVLPLSCFYQPFKLTSIAACPENPRLRVPVVWMIRQECISLTMLCCNYLGMWLSFKIGDFLLILPGWQFLTQWWSGCHSKRLTTRDVCLPVFLTACSPGTLDCWFLHGEWALWGGRSMQAVTSHLREGRMEGLTGLSQTSPHRLSSN